MSDINEWLKGMWRTRFLFSIKFKLRKAKQMVFA